MSGRLAKRLRRVAEGRDLALAYAGVVLAVDVVLALLPADVAADLRLRSSTNLVNLRDNPLLVLAASAFVLDSLRGLYVLPLLVLAYGAVQRWLGRAAAAGVGALGHVGATLFVAVVLASGIAHRQVALSERAAEDVGVSYGLVAVAGLLVARVPRRWLPAYGGGITVWLVLNLVVGGTFTDLGHVTAWGLGVLLAGLVHRAQRSEGRLPAPG